MSRALYGGLGLSLALLAGCAGANTSGLARVN